MASCPDRLTANAGAPTAAARPASRRAIWAVLAAAGLALLAAGCLAGGAAETPTDTGLDGAADLPQPSDAPAADASPDTAADASAPPACSRCHPIAALSESPGGAGLAPGDWMALPGQGLIRHDPGMPVDGETYFEFPWARRGHHPAGLTDAACASCHPVADDGIGHSASVYPADARVLAHATGGSDCASACHDWLPPEAHGSGFPDAAGLAPSLAVPGRPAAALAAVDGAHARIWRSGYTPEVPRADLRAGLLAPGCAGCHGAAFDRHGEIATCVYCHDFGAEDDALHGSHIALIARGRAQNDPTAPDRSVCLYCHNHDDPESAAPDETYRAACYRCHWSAHQPLDAAGQAHFWPPSR